jgi:hypothetical protein
MLHNNFLLVIFILPLMDSSWWQIFVIAPVMRLAVTSVTGRSLCRGDVYFRILCTVHGSKHHLCTVNRVTDVATKPSVRECNWATLFLGGINTGTWLPRFGESQMRQ